MSERSTRESDRIQTPPGQELVRYLERDQLSADTAIPVPRARWSRRAQASLWALRIFVLVVTAMVFYTFAANLK